jgi:hypothetical protein
MDERTVREHTIELDPWPIIETWVAASGFKPRPGAAGARLFQKGTGFLVAPMMFQIEQRGKEFRFEAWIRTPLVTRIMMLFLMPAEIHVGSGGFLALIPRRIARDAINTLFARLELPPIE